MFNQELVEIEVTKYDPIYRNSEGIYTTDEWIGVDDIGKENNGKILYLDEYLKTEDKYVEAVKYLFEYYKSEKIQLVGKEIRHYEDLMNIENLNYKDYHENLHNRRTISIGELDIVVRLSLRCSFWAHLVSKKNRDVSVEFGYDYYMYFKILKEDEDIITEYIEKKIGLFVRNIPA